MSSILKVNKISPESGTTLTLGDSGDTINFGTGVLPNFENLTVTGDLTVDTNSLKVDSTNNRVGIGTATPSVSLDVVGAITATGNITGTLATAAQPNITSVGTLTGFTSTGIDDNATSVAITIDSSERVAIGTTSPTAGANLTLSGEGFLTTGADSGSIAFGSNPSYQGRIYQDNSGSDLYIENTYSNNNGDIIVKTNGSERFRVKGSGEIGIGTTAPTTPLYIKSNTPILTFEETDQSNRKFQIGSFGNAYAIYDATNTQYRYILDNSGNHIFNEGSQDCDFRVESNNNANMLFVDGGNDRVGIGTSSPSVTLDVNSSSQTTLLKLTSTAGTSSAITFANTGSNDSIAISAESDDLKLRTDDGNILFAVAENSEKMRITSAGNVGIGTSSPSSTLDVAGNATITTADNSNTLSLVSTDADAISGPRISMRRESGSPADNDIIGQIYFTGKDDGGNNTDYASIRAKISDATHNTEDGALEFQSFRSGFFNNSLTLGPTETVFNDDSVDIDFRVESNGNANMLFVDGGNDRVGIGTSGPLAKLHVDTSNSGVALNSEADDFFVESNSHTGMTIGSGSSHRSSIYFANSSDNDIARIVVSHAEGSMRFNNNASERMRIDSSGRLLFSKTSSDNSVQGVKLSGGQIVGTVANDDIMILNRTGTDGKILRFFKDTADFGSIGVNTGNNPFFSGSASNHGGIAFSDAGASQPTMLPMSGGTTLADNSQNIGHPNYRWKNAYIGGSIFIGGTGSSNELSDYEEGTWTPGMSVSSSGNSGTYTKIGNLVFARFKVIPTGSGTNVVITGLPFTSTGATTGEQQGGSRETETSGKFYFIRVSNNSTEAMIIRYDANTTVDGTMTFEGQAIYLTS